MPRLNLLNVNIPDNYYYVYIRDDNNQQIFKEESDYRFFFSLFEKNLSKVGLPNHVIVAKNRLNDSVEVLAYCMMPNHFHLLVYQIDENGIKKLMNNIMKSYSRYFSRKYKSNNQLFEDIYETSCISSDKQLLITSRKIHLSPDKWIDYPYSSLRAYLYDDATCWMNKDRISKIYGTAVRYLKFLKKIKKQPIKI